MEAKTLSLRASTSKHSATDRLPAPRHVIVQPTLSKAATDLEEEEEEEEEKEKEHKQCEIDCSAANPSNDL